VRYADYLLLLQEFSSHVVHVPPNVSAAAPSPVAVAKTWTTAMRDIQAAKFYSFYRHKPFMDWIASGGVMAAISEHCLCEPPRYIKDGQNLSYSRMGASFSSALQGGAAQKMKINFDEEGGLEATLRQGELADLTKSIVHADCAIRKLYTFAFLAVGREVPVGYDGGESGDCRTGDGKMYYLPLSIVFDYKHLLEKAAPLVSPVVLTAVLDVLEDNLVMHTSPENKKTLSYALAVEMPAFRSALLMGSSVYSIPPVYRGPPGEPQSPGLGKSKAAEARRKKSLQRTISAATNTSTNTVTATRGVAAPAAKKLKYDDKYERRVGGNPDNPVECPAFHRGEACNYAKGCWFKH